MFFFSKSKYCQAWQCPKLLWLSKYKPELQTLDSSLETRFEAGNLVGDLAMGLFGDFTEVTAYKEDNKLDLTTMKELTRKYIADGVENICEASFDHEGLYCAVDILHKESDGYAIYEVKSSTHASYIYSVDIAYQKYVLEQCGINITGTYLVCIDSSYVRGEALDINKLFHIIDVSNEVNIEHQNVPSLLKKAKEIYSLKDEPALDYHNLEQIHNGSEAMSIFPKIKDMSPTEQENARRNLLKYCELDTYAMVKVWEELVRVTE